MARNKYPEKTEKLIISVPLPPLRRILKTFPRFLFMKRPLRLGIGGAKKEMRIKWQLEKYLEK